MTTVNRQPTTVHCPLPMFGFKAKTWFNATPLKKAVDDGARRVMMRFGAYVRRVAISSIVEADGPAPPGQPPHTHRRAARKAINRARKAAGKAARSARGFFQGLRYIRFDATARSVIIGPASNRTRSITIPRILEEGELDVAQRPFMGPAFKAGKQKLPEFWAGSVKK